jgi:hypothetical protein
MDNYYFLCWCTQQLLINFYFCCFIVQNSNQLALALGDSAFQREQLGKWNLGPGFEVAKEWAQEREADATPMVDNLSIFHLPVGVRPSEELKDSLEITFRSKKHEPDAGMEAVMEFTSSLLKAKHANSNKPKKHGVLSVRAASMLVKVTCFF